MTGRHLGERVHDLLDNRLPTAAAAEAMAHLETCEECASRFEELRRAREALHSSECGIDVGFARQLLDRQRMEEIARQEDPSAARAARGRDRRPVVLSMSMALLLVAVLGAAYVAGSPRAVGSEVTASSEDGAVSVAHLDSVSMRAGEWLGSWLHPDWEASGLAPVEAKEKVTPSGTPYLVALVLADSTPVKVVEFAGRLDPTTVADAPVLDVDGVDAYVIDTAPTRLVWQAGEHVVFLQCSCTQTTLERVAVAFPKDGEPGFVDQIATGLSVFSDALTGR